MPERQPTPPDHLQPALSWVRRIYLVGATVCLFGSGLSLWLWCATLPPPASNDQALVDFLRHGVNIQPAPGILLTTGFFLCALFWIRQAIKFHPASSSHPVKS